MSKRTKKPAPETRGRPTLSESSPTTHLHMRVSESEKGTWEGASRKRGFESLSEWVRDVLNRSAAQ